MPYDPSLHQPDDAVTHRWVDLPCGSIFGRQRPARWKLLPASLAAKTRGGGWQPPFCLSHGAVPNALLGQPLVRCEPRWPEQTETYFPPGTLPSATFITKAPRRVPAARPRILTAPAALRGPYRTTPCATTCRRRSPVRSQRWCGGTACCLHRFRLQRQRQSHGTTAHRARIIAAVADASNRQPQVAFFTW